MINKVALSRDQQANTPWEKRFDYLSLTTPLPRSGILVFTLTFNNRPPPSTIYRIEFVQRCQLFLTRHTHGLLTVTYGNDLDNDEKSETTLYVSFLNQQCWWESRKLFLSASNFQARLPLNYIPLFTLKREGESLFRREKSPVSPLVSTPSWTSCELIRKLLFGERSIRNKRLPHECSRVSRDNVT